VVIYQQQRGACMQQLGPEFRTYAFEKLVPPPRRSVSGSRPAADGQDGLLMLIEDDQIAQITVGRIGQHFGQMAMQLRQTAAAWRRD
jgi:hypothetical protein